MAEDLSTNAFLIAFRKFQNRRGKVNTLYSDNGTNFVGANKELKSLVQEINKTMSEGLAT